MSDAETLAAGPLGPAAEGARHRLLELISSGSLRGGERQGNERDLAAGLGVSRSTLRQALGSLEREGVVRRVPGRGGGTFVTPAQFDRNLSRIAGVPSMLRDQGFLAGSRVMSAAVVAADDVTARALALDPGAFALDVVRIRLADGAPISLEHARFPADRFPDLLEQSLGGSIHELIERRHGVVPAEAIEQIEVREAADDEALILGCAPGAALVVDHPHHDRRRRPPDRVLPRPVPRRPDADHRAHPRQPGGGRFRPDPWQGGRAASPLGVTGRPGHGRGADLGFHLTAHHSDERNL